MAAAWYSPNASNNAKEVLTGMAARRKVDDREAFRAYAVVSVDA